MGGIGPWLAGQWFDWVQTVGIVASLVFTAVALRRESQARRAGYLVDLTKLHRQLWLEMCRRPDLARLLSHAPNLEQSPVTGAEERFVNLLIVHLSTVWELVREGKVVRQEAVERDVRAFFSLPLPRTVWDRTKAVRDQGFVRFVERCLPPVNFEADTGPAVGDVASRQEDPERCVSR